MWPFKNLRDGHGDPSRRYYVYVWFIVHNGREIPLYAGKGTGNRVVAHESIYRNKIKRKRKLDAKERLFLLAEDLGYQLHWRVIESGLNEDEAFNLENETINRLGLLQRGNVAYPHRVVRPVKVA